MKSWHNTIKYAAIAFAVLIIIGTVSGLMGFFSLFTPFLSTNAVGEYTTYEIKNEISVLDIDIHSIELEIITSADPNLRVESNYKHLSVVEDNNTLLIKDKSKQFLNAHGLAVLKIYIPENKTFDKVKINFGSSRSNLDSLQARSIDMRFGTGKAVLQKITASDDAYIDAGAGQLVIRDSEFNNLHLEVGVGSFEFTGALFGRNTLNMGIGSSQINLLGSLDDYRLNVVKGLGNIQVDKRSIQDDAQLGQGDIQLFVEGGIGSIRISFAKQ
jgi:hypothetical protein